MPLLLPALSKYCIGMSACGKLGAPNEETQKFVEKMKGTESVVGYTLSKRKLFLRIEWGHSSQSDFHIDVIRKGWIRDSLVKVATTDVDSIQKAIDRVMGNEIAFVSQARYIVPDSEVQKGGMIPFHVFEKKGGDVALSQIGGKWRLKSAPVDILEWEAIQENKFGVTMSSHNTTVLSSDYLTSTVNRLDDVFGVLILVTATKAN